MAQSITLSAAVRSNLLALENTSKLIDRTQDRLSTGLRVNSPVDDAKAFFESKALSDRASTINEKKDSIDQAVSSVSVALQAVNSLDSIVEQLKGVVNSAASASTAAEFTELNTQFGSLVAQIDNLAADSTYQGVNLINGTGTTLSVSFSNLTSSSLSIASVDLRQTGLGIASSATLSAATTRATVIATLDSAIATLNAKAKTLGSNVALLQTRLDFSTSYANELQAGADKLVLAEITEEGANLVALQTRQQLGISSLSFAGNSEQSILSLFR
ncbi:MAG: flagellin [Alphaproteobacteria bacterium]|jgi:flagellin